MKIKQKKSHTVLSMLALLVPLAMFLFFCIFDMRKLSHDYSVWLDSAVVFWLLRGLCALGAAFLVYGVVYFIKQLFSDNYLIEITDTALIDHSSAISVGEIPFSQIERAYIKDQFLVIQTKDPDMFLSRLGPAARLLAKSNKKLGYDTICISPLRFQKQAFEFLSALNKKVFIVGFQDITEDEE